jgi:U32 family peptidase
MRQHLPELLAPAGDWDCAKAAIENGADAIYFGLEKFNARMRANNFTEADLPKLMDFLHRRGVKGYITFNTLVFENELAEAERYARAFIAAGVDAAIVQDAGICRLIRQLSPDFPIHASTQMTITSAAGIHFARELGCSLVVLARECSLKEIERLTGNPRTPQSAAGTEGSAVTDAAPASIPIEVFVHGALCIAYSGQCLTSESLGGRSANRGECAQACRMPYDLVSDGKQVPLGDRKYLLSPQDLASLDLIPELARIGVASLKIEGRLKTPEYVASITRLYRNALDQLVPRGLAPLASDRQVPPAVPDPRYEMEMAFSRGLYAGWFGGTNNQRLVHGRFGKKRGVYLGEVIDVPHEGVILQLDAPLKPGDGVVFDAGQPEEKEEGGRVYEIKPCRDGQATPRGNGEAPADRPRVLLTFGRGDIDFSRVHVGDKLWKTSDPELERRLRQSFEGESPKYQRPIFIEIHGFLGKPLTLLAQDNEGHVVRQDSAVALAQAERQPLTEERLREQLGRLGGTPFRLGGLKNFLQGEVLLPISELNRLRRAAVQELELLRARPLRWKLQSTPLAPVITTQPRRSAPANPPQVVVLVRNQVQLEAALRLGVQTIYCEFEDPKKYRDAVSQFRQSAFRTERSELFAAPPRIFKMGEEWTLRQVRSSNADGYLIRNYDHLNYFAHERRIGDYSLNIANRLAADYFRNKFGLERVTASYDLNFTQLEALLQATPPEWFEITIHQHMPMFHMEHCLFCAFLSNGTDYTNCGRPCDKHDVQLRDRVGALHPVKADAGCRNTVFNALAQTGAEYVARMMSLGVTHFRLEFLNETPDQVAQTITKYRQLLSGEITGAQLWRELKLFNQLGVTRGSNVTR